MAFVSLLLAAQATAGGAYDPGPNPLLAQAPTVNATTIVFNFAGDLWTVPRSGGQATRLTSALGSESNPSFSPDGKTIAFTGEYDGNGDVFTVPLQGGVPKRLTAHPAYDTVLGWTPDGSSIVFTSGMNSTNAPRLFTVSAKGGVPKALPFPMGTQACYSPDGTKIAYVPGFKWEPAWKRYRGGQAYPIWIAQLSDSKVKPIPRKDENNEQPMWIGDSIYYISDKRGSYGLYRYDTDDGKVTEEIPGSGFDIKSASAWKDVIVYEKLGSINLFDLKTKKSTRVPIEVHGDFPEVRPQIKDLSPYISSLGISPTGQRAVLEARGFIFTVPANKGDARLITEKQGVHRREPSWSPDGRTLAYISDEHGVQEMALYDVQENKERFITLGESPAYYNGGTWSPDSTKIAYQDYRKMLWVLDVKSGVSTKVDQGIYGDPSFDMTAHWSPDSKWIIWNRDLDNHLKAVFVYNVETKQKSQLTNGLANARSPIFDRDGKTIYFFASTNTGWAASWLDMTSLSVPNVTSSVYAIVLRKDGENPLRPESDEEVIKETPPDAPPAPPGPGGQPGSPGGQPGGPGGQPAGGGAAPGRQGPPGGMPGGMGRGPAPIPDVKIDVEGIERRIIALPLPLTNYSSLEPGMPGTFFALATGNKANSLDFGGPGTILKFSMAERKASPFATGAFGMQISASGTHMLLQRAGGPAIVSTQMPPQPGQGTLDLSGLKTKIDPKTEWKAMFHEIWRNEPLLFYDAGLHGIDPKEMVRRYEPFLENIASRGDLNYLFEDMTGELSIGHMWAQGGDIPGAKGVPGGLLGADFAFENGKYRITRVYDGETWNPNLIGPLAVPGVNAQAGEYLLEIDGKKLNDEMDIYEFLEGRAGKQVRVKIGPTPDGNGAREGIVVPVGSETGLRTWAWREDNRRKVSELSGGKLGYVHIPDTQFGGWSNFQRFYYAQTDKQGMIIDERFNQGGLINDFMISEMMRPFSAVFTGRYSQKDFPTPGASVFGPKVMIANQFAGSGGDMFPWLFKHHKIGPVIGKRTWGGLVAAFGFPLVDGGYVRSPDNAFYNPWTGDWDVEGHGVDPDIDVELDPYLWRQGHDAQLEKAVAVAMDLLSKTKLPTYHRPPSADKTKVKD